ncbi:MAG: hypothetical protein FJ253_11865 [Phycisphaerae bacterium]|nr:hypothetical protein [Phycisphaerae bacterium]
MLATLALVLPFCGCHALSLLGRVDLCCRPIATAPPRCAQACCSSPAAESTDPGEPHSESERRAPAIPGCESDTCCVKSAPSPAPWQMPALVCVAFTSDAAATTAASAEPRRLRDWPPTLPLGQPPTPLDLGTLLLV